MAREGQGYPCYQRDMMMMMIYIYIYIYIYIICGEPCISLKKHIEIMFSFYLIKYKVSVTTLNLFLFFKENSIFFFKLCVNQVV